MPYFNAMPANVSFLATSYVPVFLSTIETKSIKRFFLENTAFQNFRASLNIIRYSRIVVLYRNVLDLPLGDWMVIGSDIVYS